MLAAYGAFTSYVISKTTHFHYCIVPDEMCIMEWESSWIWFYMNHYIFHEDMRQKQFFIAASSDLDL